jgi:hypothetical protein
MTEGRAREAVREGVRDALLRALSEDFDRIGLRTALRLIAAGSMGVAGAVGTTLAVTVQGSRLHDAWHLAVCGTVWTGLLVVGLSLLLLRIRTPTMAVGRAAAAGVLGLALAAACSALCPEPRFLDWWVTTALGGWARVAGGLAVSALLLGLVTTLLFGSATAFLVLRERRPTAWSPFLPAAILVVLLAPGVALHSVGTSFGVFGA